MWSCWSCKECTAYALRTPPSPPSPRKPPLQGYLAHPCTSLIRNVLLLGPYSGTMPKAVSILGGGAVSYGRGYHVRVHAQGAPAAVSSLKWRVGSYRGYSKSRTHTTLGPYGRSTPESIGPSNGRFVSLISRNSCTSYRTGAPRS
jgi:hypothetical protein